jgi:drug/metabolite transporter (DMT)-like permease
MFGALGLIWGASFLLIKMAVAPAGAIPNDVGLFDPLSLASFRLVLAAIGFSGLMILTRRKLPTDGRTLAALVLAGFLNNAIPYALITWGERTIDSGLASVLNATTPLFSLIIAHFALSDDKMTLGKIFGLISGFTGIVLLATRTIDPSHPNPLPGQLAMVGASLSYACAAVFIRKTLRHVEAMTTAAVSINAGAVMILVFTLLTVRPLPILTGIQPSAWAAVLILGVMNTFVAYILFFTLMAAWGPSRTTLVTYMMPPIGVVLGVLIEHETVDWKLIVGAALIVGGVAAANLWRGKVKPKTPEVPPLSADRPIVSQTTGS